MEAILARGFLQPDAPLLPLQPDAPCLPVPGAFSGTPIAAPSPSTPEQGAGGRTSPSRTDSADLSSPPVPLAGTQPALGVVWCEGRTPQLLGLFHLWGVPTGAFLPPLPPLLRGVQALSSPARTLWAAPHPWVRGGPGAVWGLRTGR